MSKNSILSFHFTQRHKPLIICKYLQCKRNTKLYAISRTCEALIFGFAIPALATPRTSERYTLTLANLFGGTLSFNFTLNKNVN